MIDAELEATACWPADTAWQQIADRAIAAAIAQTHFAPLARRNFALSVSVRLAEDAEVQLLNRNYRQKDKPTNVLSFPMLDAALLSSLANTDDGEVLLGDLILAHETCAREAAEKGIPLEQHVTHLIVHGTLHLLGYDHMEDAEADAMEALEIKALASLGLPNPYSDSD